MVGTSVGFPWIFWVLSLGCLHYSYIEIMDYFSLFILFFPNILSCCFFFLKCLTFLNINLSPYISVFVSDTVCSDLLSWMANGFIQSLGTACGPTHLQHCPLHIYVASMWVAIQKYCLLSFCKKWLFCEPSAYENLRNQNKGYTIKKKKKIPVMTKTLKGKGTDFSSRKAKK